jgi:hypothetical protein
MVPLACMSHIRSDHVISYQSHHIIRSLFLSPCENFVQVLVLVLVLVLVPVLVLVLVLVLYSYCPGGPGILMGLDKFEAGLKRVSSTLGFLRLVTLKALTLSFVYTS